MKIRLSFKKAFLLAAGIFFILQVQAQFLVDLIDTASSEEKGLWAIYRKSDHLQISGYFQPQFQTAQTKGAKNFSGGDFSEHSNNRIMLRRARIRFDYAHFSDQGLPQAQVVLQFDGSERGVVIRDMWGRLYENQWQLFSFTTGMFARPFGFELNLSSNERETPERGRMSQILMRTERDLGVMATFEPRKKSNRLRLLKFDLGVFNGQGLTGPEEYDSYKDFIGKVSVKPYPLSDKISVSASASMFQGGIVQNSRYIYRFSGVDGNKTFVADSSENNLGRKAPRRYRGLDTQLRIRNAWGKTELRGEYWWGTQTSGADQSNTPGIVLTEPHYIRNFNGAFFYILQSIVNDKHQVILKYDFYDPNRHVKGRDIGVNGTNTHEADIRYNTFGAGYQFQFNTHLKMLVWYDNIRNEHTAIEGFVTDVRDNIFTCRLQYRF